MKRHPSLKNVFAANHPGRTFTSKELCELGVPPEAFHMIMPPSSATRLLASSGSKESVHPCDQGRKE